MRVAASGSTPRCLVESSAPVLDAAGLLKCAIHARVLSKVCPLSPHPSPLAVARNTYCCRGACTVPTVARGRLHNLSHHGRDSIFCRFACKSRIRWGFPERADQQGMRSVAELLTKPSPSGSLQLTTCSPTTFLSSGLSGSACRSTGSHFYSYFWVHARKNEPAMPPCLHMVRKAAR